MLLALTLLFGARPAGALAATQPQAAPAAPDRDVVILYTNDVHCGVNEGAGYAGIAALKQALLAKGDSVALVDAGDAVQGEPLGAVGRGEYPIDIMNAVGYDLMTLGNHEFDYGMDRFFELADRAAFPIVCCNFTDLRTNKPVFDGYRILKLGGVNVAFVGVATPKTITSSTPAYFQDETGAYRYGFQQDETGEKLYACVQGAVDAARADGADYVVVLGHCGVAVEASPWTSTEIIRNTARIDVWIDGHSHTAMEGERVKNKDGKNVLLTQTGTKLAAVGLLRIDALGGISTRLVTDNGVAARIGDIEKQYAEQMKQVVATAAVDLTVTMPGEPDTRIVRNMETNLGDLCADAYRFIGGADVGFSNGGGIRKGIPAGDVTYEDVLSVFPFGNNLCVVEATGQQILDALEFGVKNLPEEFGGFLQASGLRFEVHTYLPSAVRVDESKMFAGVDGEYRVKNVVIGDAPLDPAKTYTVASHDYLLKNGGDGNTVFKNCRVVKDMVMTDNQMLTAYMTENLGGTVGDAYKDPFGQGRIVFVEKQPEAVDALRFCCAGAAILKSTAVPLSEKLEIG